MNAKKVIRSYIGPSAFRKALSWIFALAAVALLAAGVYFTVHREDPRDAARFDSITEDSGDFVFLDVIALDEQWLFKYTIDSEVYTFYTVMAADEYYYITVLSDAQFGRMEAQREFWYEYDYEEPIPANTAIYRIYGLACPIDDDIRKDIAYEYDYTSSDVDDIFGCMYLDATARPSQGLGKLLLTLAFACFLWWVWSVFANGLVKGVARRSIKRLEQLGRLDAAAEELNGRVKIIGSDKCRFSENFVFVKRLGTALSYDDILLYYRARASLFSGASAVFAATKINRAFPIVRSRGFDRSGMIDSVMATLAERAPSALSGITPENQQSYSAMIKELKAAAKNEPKAKEESLTASSDNN